MTAQEAARRSPHRDRADGFVQVKDARVDDSASVPTNMPCISVAPFKLADKDIQVSFYLASNRVSRGY